MTQHKDSVRLQHMLEYAREAVNMMEGKIETRSNN